MPGHLTVEERDRLAQLRYAKFSQEEIALALGRSASTVSREICRNGTGGDYHAGIAQRKAEQRRPYRPLSRKVWHMERKCTCHVEKGEQFLPTHTPRTHRLTPRGKSK